MRQFKNVKNTHGGMLLLVKLQAEAWNCTKSNTPPWVFSRFLKCTNSSKTNILLCRAKTGISLMQNDFSVKSSKFLTVN